MARTNNLSNFLTDVAGAIKEKKGSEVAIPAANFDTEIRNLPSQGTYQHKTVPVTQNGTQTVIPDAGYDAIDELTINTTVPEKQLQTKTYNFTQNATLELTPDSGYDGFNQVNLNINVAGGEVNNQDKTITENGVYTADQGYTGIGTATVNVPQPQTLEMIIPNSINVDLYQQSNGVSLFNLPKNFDGNVYIMGFVKWDALSDWIVQSIGSYYIMQGTVSDAMMFSFWNMDYPYAKLRVIITKSGYNTIEHDISVNVVHHEYGRLNLCIQQSDVQTIKNDVIITAINEDDPSILPVRIALTDDYWPTWTLDLPAGYWSIRFTYASFTELIETSVYISNDSNGWSYPYINLPGFTYSCYHNVEYDDNFFAESVVSAVITVYDENDTVLHTENISYRTDTITYTYVGLFDHYTVVLTDWTDASTDTNTYTQSQDTTYTTHSPSYYYGYLNFTLDNTEINTISGIQNIIQDADISFVERDENTYIRDIEYVICHTAYNGYIVAIRYPVNTPYSQWVICDGQNYEHREFGISNYAYGWGSQINLAVKQPIITYSITLKDINGYDLPFSTYGNISISQPGGSYSYGISEGSNNETILTITTKKTLLMYGGDLWFHWPTYDENTGYIAFTIATYGDIEDYEQDTTIAMDLVVPTTIDPNSAVVTMMLWTAEWMEISNIANIVYDTITDGTNTYELVRATSSGYTEAYYMVKIPAETTVYFRENSFMMNGATYHAPELSVYVETGNNIYSTTCQCDSIFIENTSMVSPIGIYEYNGGPETEIDAYSNYYKIEMYRNGTLVDTYTDMSGFYRCPISFYVNDIGELRVYRNEGSTTVPEWSTRYTSQQFNVTQTYTYISLNPIYLEEVDAYIDQTQYENKHVYNLASDRVIDTYVEELQAGTLLCDDFSVVNIDGDDITSYMISIGTNIYDIDALEYVNYDITYDSVNRTFTYTDSTDLPFGHYSIDIYVVDQYGGSIQTSYEVTVMPLFPFEDNLPYTCDNGAIINSIEGEYNNGITSFIIHDIDFKDVDGVLNQGLYTFDMVLYDMDDNILNTLHTLGIVMFNGYHKTVTDGRASITSDYRNTARIEITNVQYSPS